MNWNVEYFSYFMQILENRLKINSIPSTTVCANNLPRSTVLQLMNKVICILHRAAIISRGTKWESDLRGQVGRLFLIVRRHREAIGMELQPIGGTCEQAAL